MKLRHRKVGKVCRGFKYIGGGGGGGGGVQSQYVKGKLSLVCLDGHVSFTKGVC